MPPFNYICPMSDSNNDKKTDKRPKEYEPKLKFDGTFEQLIDISIKDSKKKNAQKKPKP